MSDVEEGKFAVDRGKLEVAADGVCVCADDVEIFGVERDCCIFEAACGLSCCCGSVFS